MFFYPGGVGVQANFTSSNADATTTLGPSINPGSQLASKGFSCFSSTVNGSLAGITSLGGFVDVVGVSVPALPFVAVTGWAHIAAGANQAHGWGGWFRASDDTTSNFGAIAGTELDVVLNLARTHSTTMVFNGGAYGLVINNQSAPARHAAGLHATAAVLIARDSDPQGAGLSQWFTGIGNQADSIVAGDANEFLQINGSTLGANSHCGIRYAGNITTGIDMSGATFAAGYFPFLLPNKVAGFGTPTGNSVIQNFSGAGATLAQTSATVSQILAVLIALGFIGS